MKQLLIALITGCFLFSCANEEEGNTVGTSSKDFSKPTTASVDTSKKSIASEVSKQISNADIKISYHAPAVRGRTIWGGLVPLGEVWVTGAHKATSLEVGKEFKVGERTVPAGKYALFTIPGKDQWTVIINKNWNQHLTDEYSETDDVARLTVKPQVLTSSLERLKYEINQEGEKAADIIISWEKVRVPFRIELK